MPYVDATGARIYYEDGGDGPTLLLIPGLSGTVTGAAKIVDPLREHLRVLVLDNRGAGRSDKPDEPYSIERFAADALAVLDATGIEQAGVLGISMGGRIALELAINHPGRVGRLVLLSTGARVKRKPGRRGLMDLVARLPVAKGPHPQPYYAYRRQLVASGSYDAGPRLGDVQAPTLVIGGRQDGIAVPELSEELRAGIPDAQLRWVDGGHMAAFLGAHDEVIRMVTEFLTSPR
jgi:3-oxoadipate enol-lactonase